MWFEEGRNTYRRERIGSPAAKVRLLCNLGQSLANDSFAAIVLHTYGSCTAILEAPGRT